MQNNILIPLILLYKIMTSIQSTKYNLNFEKLTNYKKLTVPELFFIVSNEQIDCSKLLNEVIKRYRMKYLMIQPIDESKVQKKTKESMDCSQMVIDYIKLIQKKISQYGNRIYLIECISLSTLQLLNLNQILSKKYHINKVINIQKNYQFTDHTKLQKSLQSLQLNSFHKLSSHFVTFDYNSENQILQSFENIVVHSGIDIPNPVPVICILGGPGSGKGTNCTNLVKDYGFKHLSTGDLLREYKQGQWYQVINSLMTEGKLVPSNILLEIVKESIDNLNYEGIFLLDGFPRNQQNMLVWHQVMSGFAEIHLYLYLQCSEETMEKRLLRRGESSGRIDDNALIIKKRFKTFQNMTVPFIKQLLKTQKVIKIDSSSSPEEVYNAIQQQFNKEGIKPLIKEEKPEIIFILGGPGSGKGTQCEILVKEYMFKHLSTGDLLRQQIKNQGAQALQIQSYIAEGKLVPSRLLLKLMKNKIYNDGWKGRYLIDGFPRSIQNLEAWNQIMKDDLKIDGLLYFDCSIETMENRLLKRGLSSGRSDDNPQTIKKRLVTFKIETKPLLDFYKGLGNKIDFLNTDQELEKVTVTLKQTLKQMKLI